MKLLAGALALVLATFAVPAAALIIPVSASLDCAQANAGLGTCGAGGSGTGTADVTFDTVTNLLAWDVSWSGLSAPTFIAHIHGPATPNQNAGVVVDFGAVGTATSGSSMGSTTLSAAQASDLLSELWYVNIHSNAFPLGEIRGQLLVPEPATGALLGASLVGFGGALRTRRRG